jgi:ABC-type transport system involved in multi-copper enzyme maturation permease subunit
MSIEAPSPAKAIPSPFVALVTYTLRSCVPPKRRIGILITALGAVLFGALAWTLEYSQHESFARVAGLGIFGLVLPIAALVIGDAVLGSEIRSGTFLFTWMSSVSLWRIVLARWVGGSIVAIVAMVPACVVASIVGGASETAGAIAIAAAAGSMAYVAVFIAIGCLARRTAVWSLAFVFLVERLLGFALSGIGQLTPSWESRAVFLGLIDDPPGFMLRKGIPEGWSAVGRLAMITAVALGIARWRMAHIRLDSASD